MLVILSKAKNLLPFDVMCLNPIKDSSQKQQEILHFGIPPLRMTDLKDSFHLAAFIPVAPIKTAPKSLTSRRAPRRRRSCP